MIANIRNLASFNVGVNRAETAVTAIRDAGNVVQLQGMI